MSKKSQKKKAKDIPDSKGPLILVDEGAFYICQTCGTMVAAHLKECPECGGIKDENI